MFCALCSLLKLQVHFEFSLKQAYSWRLSRFFLIGKPGQIFIRQSRLWGLAIQTSLDFILLPTGPMALISL